MSVTKTKKLREKKQTLRPQRRVKKRVNAAHPRTAVAVPRKRVTAELLQEMTRRLVQEFHPEQVILFGSYAWGTPANDSDVDLMVIVLESDETDQERMVRGYRSLRGLGVPKDVFVKTRAEFDYYRDVRASLQHRIAEKGKVLYDKFKQPSRAEVVSHR
jgi:predicted nucleotidyltransferase